MNVRFDNPPIAGPRKAVGCASDSRVRAPGFDTRSGHILSFLLPADSGRAVVSYWQKYVHLVQVSKPAQEKCG